MPLEFRKEFSAWLHDLLNKHHWNLVQLAQRAGISPTVLSSVLSGIKPEPYVCVGVARALRLPPEAVLRKAGLLPPVSNEEVPMETWLSILSQLPEMDRLDLLRIARQSLKAQSPAH